MVRESRHLWVGNLPDSMKNDEIADYFSRLIFLIYLSQLNSFALIYSPRVIVIFKDCDSNQVRVLNADNIMGSLHHAHRLRRFLRMLIWESFYGLRIRGSLLST